MSLLIAAHFLKSWNQTGNSYTHVLINWSLRSSAMCCVLRPMMLLEKDTFRSRFPADTNGVRSIDIVRSQTKAKVFFWKDVKLHIINPDKSCPSTRPWRPIGLSNVDEPTLSRPGLANLIHLEGQIKFIEHHQGPDTVFLSEEWSVSKTWIQLLENRTLQLGKNVYIQLQNAVTQFCHYSCEVKIFENKPETWRGVGVNQAAGHR
jgi:hypothetical protein